MIYKYGPPAFNKTQAWVAQKFFLKRAHFAAWHSGILQTELLLRIFPSEMRNISTNETQEAATKAASTDINSKDNFFLSYQTESLPSPELLLYAVVVVQQKPSSAQIVNI